MTTIDLSYSFTDLKQAFKLKSDSATRARLRAVAADGFPPRLPGGEPRWSKPAVDGWFANWGQPRELPAMQEARRQRRAALDKAYGRDARGRQLQAAE